jgi:4,5-dihydroxyphthalate decarboxylase
MSRLPITIATWDYDRVRALTDGRVHIEGCDVNYLTMPVEECFERAYFHGEFDVAEIGFSPYLIALSRGSTPYVAIPIFLSRMFRHSAVYVRTDRGIEGPADLRGKRIGVPEYQMSAVLWFRGYLQDEHGITYQLDSGRPRKSRPPRQASAQSAARVSARIAERGNPDGHAGQWPN